jgi:cytochrome c oxidase subunit 2
MDVNHGFSLYPANINFQVVPGYDYGLTIQPNQPGEYRIVCNEFCGINHHAMLGSIVVEPAARVAAAAARPFTVQGGSR